jgi:hypothetical protein
MTPGIRYVGFGQAGEIANLETRVEKLESKPSGGGGLFMLTVFVWCVLILLIEVVPYPGVMNGTPVMCFQTEVVWPWNMDEAIVQCAPVTATTTRGKSVPTK